MQTMLKILLILGAALFLLACGKTVLAKKGDKYIWLEEHSSYPKTQPHWKKYELKHKTYFGQYTYFNDHFNDYYGDPLGPIVAIWEVTQYLGEEPKFKDCGKEPKISDKVVIGTPEYKQEKSEWSKKYDSYYSCLDENESIKQKSKTITYYYARSTNNYLPILPPRPKNHGVYEINISFGPMGDIPLEGLSLEEKKRKDQLDGTPCHWRGVDTTCYRLPGKDNHLYYTVRSMLKSDASEKGKVSATWKVAGQIRKISHQWQEIKGIEISKAQYDYMKTRCEGIFSCYLDDKAPGLTEKQKDYIKATAWELDTNVEARNALIKKSDKYRADEQ